MGALACFFGLTIHRFCESFGIILITTFFVILGTAEGALGAQRAAQLRGGSRGDIDENHGFGGFWRIFIEFGDVSTTVRAQKC